MGVSRGEPRENVGCCVRHAGGGDRFGSRRGAGERHLPVDLEFICVAGCKRCRSQCDSSGQNIGQFFTLGSSAVTESLTFDVSGVYDWPTSVTVNIFQDSGEAKLGALVYGQTFSSFARDTPTGYGADVVSVNLGGGVSLAAGSYDIWLWNPNNLGVPQFFGLGAGNQIAQDVGGGVGPSTGDGYYFVGPGNYDSGVLLSSTAASSIPEPATWAMTLAGLAGLGFVGYRASRKAAFPV